VSDEEVSFYAKNGERCGVGFNARSLVVENQDAVEGVLENGLELAPGNGEFGGRFPIIPAQEDQISGVEHDSEAEPAHRSDEKIGCQSSMAKSCHKNGGKEDDRSEKNEKSASLKPTHLKMLRPRFFQRLFVQSHKLLASSPRVNAKNEPWSLWLRRGAFWYFNP